MRSARNCPVCNSDATQAAPFLAGNIEREKLTQYSYASRKTPEFMCHHLIRCKTCDLVYADQPPSDAELAHAYHEAHYDTPDEASDAALAYIHAIQPALERLPHHRCALEIGTGTGIFLEHLRQHGFEELVGVEPSLSAILAAPEERRSWIRHDVFREEDFAPASFDLICCFMTLEHVADPRVIADAAMRLLRPGGAFVSVAHDYRSPINRLLGKRSPIIDIEHMQLFSRSSILSLYRRSGYAEIAASSFKNRYAIGYWARLLPLPEKLKAIAQRALTAARMNRLKLGLNVGNMIAIGFKSQ